MFAEPRTWVDVEGAIRAWARCVLPALDERVFFGFSNDAPLPQVVLTRIAGPDDRCLVQFDCWAKTKAASALLAGNLATALDALSRFTHQQTVLHGARVESVDPALHQNPRVHPVANLRVSSESRDVWNHVVPLGAGEGINRLDLAYCDRSVAAGDPYDVASTPGPDGRPYYYLEDAALVAAYGRRVKPLLVKEAVPLANSATGFRSAANALYDIAATWLQRRRRRPPRTR